MAKAKPPELQVPIEPGAEHIEGKDKGNPIQRLVQSISHLHKRTGDEIAHASQERIISPDEAQRLQQERSGCLTVALSAISKVVPTMFKARLYESLQARNLDNVYILSLDPQTQAAELTRLIKLYQGQVSHAPYRSKNPQEVLLHTERAVDGLLTVISRRGLDEQAGQVLDYTIQKLSQKDSPGNIDHANRARLARKILEYGLKNGEPGTKKRVLIDYATNFDDDSSSQLAAIAPEDRLEVAQSILVGLGRNIFSRGEYVFNLLDGLDEGQRQALISNLLSDSLRIKKPQDRIPATRRILAYASSNQRIDLLTQITENFEFRHLSRGRDQQAQLNEIVSLTPHPGEQDTMFWQIASSHHDYRDHPGFDINAVVARAEPDFNKTSFVVTQMREGFLSPEAAAIYGSKIIVQQLEAEVVDIRSIVGVTSAYRVNLGPYRDRLSTEIEAAFKKGLLQKKLQLWQDSLVQLLLLPVQNPFI